MLSQDSLARVSQKMAAMVLALLLAFAALPSFAFADKQEEGASEPSLSDAHSLNQDQAVVRDGSGALGYVGETHAEQEPDISPVEATPFLAVPEIAGTFNGDSAHSPATSELAAILSDVPTGDVAVSDAVLQSNTSIIALGDFDDPSLYFQFKVTVSSGDLGFYLPTSGGNFSSRPYNWKIYWNTTGSLAEVSTHSGTSRDVSEGILHTYNQPGTYTITIVPNGGSDAWLAAFGFSRNTTGSVAVREANRAKVVSVDSEFYPIMTRTQAGIDSDADDSDSEWNYTFSGCTALTTTGPGFNQAAWANLTKAGKRFAEQMYSRCRGSAFTMSQSFNLPRGFMQTGDYFAANMFNSCAGDSFTMSPVFNLPPNITVVGIAFAEGLFSVCSGNSFTMNSVFNIPRNLVRVGDRFASAMFNRVSGSSFTMNAQFNLPQGIIEAGQQFANSMFYTAGGSSFQINSQFRFPRLSSAQLDKDGSLASVFTRLQANRQVNTTIGKIINGNPLPSSSKGTFIGAVPFGITQSQYQVFDDWYIQPSAWGCGDLPWSVIVYDGNGSVSGTAPIEQGGNAGRGSNGYLDSVAIENQPDIDQKTVTVVGNPGGLRKTGRVFAGWALSPSALTPDYREGDSLVVTGGLPVGGHQITLYAVYTLSPYTITFDAGSQGNIGGAQTTSITSYYGESMPVAPTPTRNTGWRFNGWRLDNSTTAYPAQQTVVGNQIYRAQWQQVTYAIYYHSSGHTSGTTPAATTHQEGSTVAAKSAESLARSSYSFLGWDTSALAASVVFGSGAQLMVNNDVHLYAVWQANPQPPQPPAPVIVYYQVAYAAGGENVTNLPVGATLQAGTAYAVPGSAPVREGFSFQGWSSSLGGSFQAGQSFTPTSSLVLTAQWQANPTYALTYFGNGNTAGNAPIDSRAYNPGESATVLGAGNLSRQGYTFAGWARTANATSAQHQVGSTLEMSENRSLYAVWTKVPVPAPTPETPSRIVTEFNAEDAARIEAQVGNIFADIANGNVPLGNIAIQGAWSVLSLLMVVLGLFIALILATLMTSKHSRTHHYLALRLAAIILGLATTGVWLALDNISLPIVWINQWTLYVGIIFVIQCVAALAFCFVRRPGDDEVDLNVRA